MLVGAIFVIASSRGMPATEVRALTFFSLVLSIASLIFVNRAFSASLVAAVTRPNAALVWVLLAVAAILSLTLLWPLASGSFGFGPLHADDIAVTFGAAVLLLMSLELMKPHWRARLRA